MSKRVCAEPQCPVLVEQGARDGRCDQHRRQRDQARGSREQRGYGKDHRAERERWAPLVATGRVKCWRCRDHIGPDEPWDLGHADQDRTRHQGPEHAACNRATSGRTPTPCAVTVVCGPPCSGKSTYVREHAQPGDLIVDYDDIARRLGSPRSHGHEFKYHRRVEDTIARAVAGIKAGRHERAWIIRSLPDAAEALAAELDAHMVLIDEPDEVLLDRADRRRDPDRTRRAITEWRAAAYHQTHTQGPTPTRGAV